jgi:hypothetical protein
MRPTVNIKYNSTLEEALNEVWDQVSEESRARMAQISRELEIRRGKSLLYSSMKELILNEVDNQLILFGDGSTPPKLSGLNASEMWIDEFLTNDSKKAKYLRRYARRGKK